MGSLRKSQDREGRKEVNSHLHALKQPTWRPPFICLLSPMICGKHVKLAAHRPHFLNVPNKDAQAGHRGWTMKSPSAGGLFSLEVRVAALRHGDWRKGQSRASQLHVSLSHS